MAPKRGDIPHHLRNIQPEEAQYIKSIFGLYDYRATGLIPRHCVAKILLKVGVEASVLSLPEQMSLREVLLFIGDILFLLMNTNLFYSSILMYINDRLKNPESVERSRKLALLIQ
jgi:hypothetical protein